METVVFDTMVENSFVKVPRRFNHRRVKIIIVDPEEEKKASTVSPRRLIFEIDESLEDVVPFSDIQDSREFVKKIRETHWQ